MSRMLQNLLVIVLLASLAACRLTATRQDAETARVPANNADVARPEPVTLAPPKASGPPRLTPMPRAQARAIFAAPGGWGYDPTSVYDQQGVNVPRGFAAEAPNEAIDPFSGNLVLYHTDLRLPGVAGLDVNLQRVYNSKIHRNYAARASGDPNRVALGMLFVPASPLGLGWSLHLGRLVGAVQGGPNNLLSQPRYYERPDGSQHPFFTYTGPGCGDGQTDICLITKQQDNPYPMADGTWRLATTDGRIITFGHAASDGSTVVRYATEIRDIHGNRIQIFYHDDTIPGIAYPRDHFRHFIDRIIDSANRTVSFGYSEVNPGLVRLSTITALGRTYRYFYSAQDPWSGLQAFLTRAEPPEGAPWRYDYAGIHNNDCADNSKRWCELTELTYPQGGTIAYTYQDHTFWAQTNPMAVRAVATREAAGRELTPGTWTYTYNRAADYTDPEHTVITRPDNTAEIYTYFGVGSGQDYNPVGSAWKAGVLLGKQIRDADGTVRQTETYDWEASPALSSEIWGDPWIGFDNGVFLARLRQSVIQRGTLSWTTTHTSYNNVHNLPRCTTEQGADGATRYRLRAYHVGDTIVQGEGFRYRNLPQWDLLSYSPYSATSCDDQFQGSIQPSTHDEVEVRDYNAEAQLAARTVNGVRTDYGYYGDGSLKDQILYQGRDPSGNPTDGFCTTYDDYLYGVAQRIEFGAPAPDCNTPLHGVQRAVNTDGSLASITNDLGHTTELDYDDLGRVIAIRPPDDDPIAVAYDGSPTSFSTNRRVTQGDYWLERRFDGLGRTIAQEDSAGVRAWQRYDALGRLTFQSQPSYTANNSAGETYAYDALGRVGSITHADNTLLSYTYGTDAHTVTIADELQRQTVLTHRAFGVPDDSWLMRVQLPERQPTPLDSTYAYHAGGHLQSAHFAGRQRDIGYNFAKKVRFETTPERGSVYWGYDAAGNLRCHDRSTPAACSDTSLNNPLADIRYTVDGLGRVIHIDYESPDTADVTFTYDAANNLETMTDGVGTHSFDYTPANRLERKTSLIHGVEYVTRYAYDPRGNLETMTYPSGRTVAYGYDAGNRLTSVGGFVSDIDYHPSGVASQLTHANGVVTTLTLDPRQRPDQLNAPAVLDLNYDYDAVGNVDRIVDGINASHSMDFDYDVLDRLTDASGAWGSLHYQYYAGDRLLERLNGQNTSYRYDSRGRLDYLSGRVNLDFTFDSFGNARQRGPLRYDYDLEDRISRVTDAQNNAIIAYGYDGQGERVLLTRPGCNRSVVYHYDQLGNRIAESTDQGLVLKEYVVAAGRTIAEIDLAPLRASVSELEFGDVRKGVGSASASSDVTLSNRGSALVTIDTVSLSNPNFSVNVTLPLQVPAGGEVTIPVIFTSDVLDEFTGNLALCIDNGMEIDVRLHARTIHGGNAPNSHTAPPDTDVVYRYSEPVDPGSVGPLTFPVYGMYTGKVPGAYTVDGSQIIFTPNLPFKPGEQVHATATTGLRYLSGGGPSSPHTWQFQVATAAAGSGRFVDSGQALGGNTGTSAVALGDLDGDGDLDAFVCRYGFPNPPGNQVWLNDGNGSFSDSGQSFGSAGSVDVDVALGDLDGDGDLDALVSNPFPTPNEVWLNDGNGVFSSHGSLGNASGGSVTLGDLDGDGDLDAFIASALWLNDGQATFSDSGQRLDTQALALGDLDGDGDLDAYAAGSTRRVGGLLEERPNAVWLNDGAAHFSKGSDVGGGPHSAALGDLDRDGDLDAFGVRQVHYNDGTGRFPLAATRYLQSTNDPTVAPSLADLDGDGDLDGFVGTRTGAEVWFNDGTGTLGDVQTVTDIRKNDAALGDLDGDGDLDAFLINQVAPDQVWRN